MDNSLDNESRAVVPIAVVTLTLTLSLITAVCLRSYTRIVMVRDLEWMTGRPLLLWYVFSTSRSGHGNLSLMITSS